MVSHWQRRNPFRDHVSHQHYLHLKRVELPPAREEFYSNCADLLDFSYRFEKRKTIFAEAEFRGNLIYSVNFIQDWSFARSIMDVVPTGKFKLILRSDIIAPEYTHFIRNFCIRTGIDFVEITSVNQGVEALERWRWPYALFVTATEGLISATHLMNSLLTLEARRMGYATLSMQHGMNVGKDLSHAAEYVGAWDAKGAQSLQSGRHPGSGWHVLDAGSPKFFEALMPMGENAFAQRFGDWTHAFRKKVLVGLNLHWRIGEESDITYRWLESVFARYPDILFILRPHPDDYTIFENSISASNVLILDEVILNVVDWPMSRIIKSVDAVTTFSTLILDALAAETPVYMLPTDFSRLDGYFLPISLPVTSLEDFSQVTREEFTNGLLPAGLFEEPVAHDRAWFDSSRRFFSRLASLRTGRNVGRLAAAEQDVRRALETAVKTLNFDVNPHSDRVRVSEGIRMFQTESF